MPNEMVPNNKLVSKQYILELCYSAVNQASQKHGSYNVEGQAQVAEGLAERIIDVANKKVDPKVEIHTDAIDTYQYLCTILDTLQTIIPLIEDWNVCLAVNRLGIDGAGGEFASSTTHRYR